MKRITFILVLLMFLFCGCQNFRDTSVITEPTEPLPTEPVTTEPATEPVTLPQETEPAYSSLCIPDLPVEDVIGYFNEVVLSAEFSNAGDPSKVQKWDTEIVYIIYGDMTEEDRQVLDTFTRWLNDIQGFPGIRETAVDAEANLRIYFCTYEKLLEILGNDFQGVDGGVTFWYSDDRIYDGKICIRTDLNQDLRNSVILEEIYNGLGPVQDTDLRQDSIIYSGFSAPQSLTAVDELILKLLYHPDIACGMDAARCESVIRELYR